MTMRAGHCTDCGKLLWRTAEAQKNWNNVAAGTVFLLWPLPESTYAMFRDGGGDIAKGIAYCEACLPQGGHGPLGAGMTYAGFERAHDRYQAWYHPERREVYATWLKDQLWLEEKDIEQLLKYWDQDREGVHA